MSDINKALAGKIKAAAGAANKMARLNPKVKSMGEMGSETHNAMARLQGAKVKKNVFGVVDKRDLHATAQASGGDTHFARRTIGVKGKLQRLHTSENNYSGPVHASSTKRVSGTKVNAIPNRKAEVVHGSPANGDLDGVKSGARTKGDSPNYKHVAKANKRPKKGPSAGRIAATAGFYPLHGLVAGKKGSKLKAGGSELAGSLVGGAAGGAIAGPAGGMAGGIAGGVAGMTYAHRKGFLKPDEGMRIHKNAFGISKASVGAANGAKAESDGAKLGGHFRKTGAKATIKRTDKGDPLGKA